MSEKRNASLLVSDGLSKKDNRNVLDKNGQAFLKLSTFLLCRSSLSMLCSNSYSYFESLTCLTLLVFKSSVIF